MVHPLQSLLSMILLCNVHVQSYLNLFHIKLREALTKEELSFQSGFLMRFVHVHPGGISFPGRKECRRVGRIQKPSLVRFFSYSFALPAPVKGHFQLTFLGFG